MVDLVPATGSGIRQSDSDASPESSRMAAVLGRAIETVARLARDLNTRLNLVSKFPEPPGVEALRRYPWLNTLESAAGARLARIYFSAGPATSSCISGLIPSRWPHRGALGRHHLPNSSDEPTEQDLAVLYCAPQVDTCAAEVFQATSRIDRIRNAPGARGLCRASAANLA